MFCTFIYHDVVYTYKLKIIRHIIQQLSRALLYMLMAYSLNLPVHICPTVSVVVVVVVVTFFNHNFVNCKVTLIGD